MIALDTNTLVRFIVADDSRQLQKILRLLASPEETFFICDAVLIELVWVLGYSYKWRRSEISDALRKLLSKTNVAVENEYRMEWAIKAYQSSGDLADHLIFDTAHQHDCESLASFDIEFCKAYPHFVFQPK